MSAAHPAFEAWWQASGQYSRAGGGDYEKTFAFNAWKASRQAALTEVKQLTLNKTAYQIRQAIKEFL